MDTNCHHKFTSQPSWMNARSHRWDQHSTLHDIGGSVGGHREWWMAGRWPETSWTTCHPVMADGWWLLYSLRSLTNKVRDTIHPDDWLGHPIKHPSHRTSYGHIHTYMSTICNDETTISTPPVDLPHSLNVMLSFDRRRVPFWHLAVGVWDLCFNF